MKIKRLEIIGFKSFVDKVTFDFQQGVTAVVGPNGCGKSNVVDAIRWVMGEQSAKNLRGKSMEDVIFGGSESRKPLGMAEVSLIFSTEDGKVPAKYLNFSEIQVTRRLYRDGESDYLLNKTPCRLLDIAELFMDTGVGAKAYSIIEQGRIGMILLAKPEERRFLIEEAAGVTKYKSRKQVALKKIDATRQNLVRIGDIVGEIRRQLGTLQRQAKKAEKFRAYRGELKEIELSIARHRHAALVAEYRLLETGLAETSNKLNDLTIKLSNRELALEERRISMLEAEKALASVQEELYRVKGDIQGGESRLEFQRKEILTLENHRARYLEELAGLSRQAVDAEVELVSLEGQKATFTAETTGEQESLVSKERELEQMMASERTVSGQLEDLRRQLFSQLSLISQYNNQHSVAAKRLESMAERLERVNRENLLLREKMVLAGGREAELVQTLETLGREKETLQENLIAIKNRDVVLKEQYLVLEQELAGEKDALSGKSSRLSSLQELEAQFAGYGQGVKTVLMSDRFKGRFVGVVADLMETDPEYETALEAVMGEKLQYVPCGKDQDALEAVSYLKHVGGGRSSFILPCDGVLRDTLPEPAASVRLLDKVRFSSEWNSLLEPLLDSVWITEDMESAVAGARQWPMLTFVTLDGDLAFGGGVVTGGCQELAGQGLIHKKREIKELVEDVAKLGQQVKELEEKREQLRKDLVRSEENGRDARQQLHELEIQMLNQHKDLENIRQESRRIEERLAVQELENDALAEEKVALELEISNSVAGREMTEARQTLLEEEIKECQRSLEENQSRIAEAREELTAAKVRAASLREKNESTLRAIKQIEELRITLQQKGDRLRSDVEKAELELSRLVKAAEESEDSLKLLIVRQHEEEDTLGKTRRSHDDFVASVQADEADLKKLRTLAEEQRQDMSALNLRLSGITMNINHIVDNIRDKYRLELATLPSVEDATDFDCEKLATRQAELQNLVDEMGEVNLTAIEEFQELEERFTFLSGQKSDLEESLNSLQKAIQRINRTTRKRFLETFQQVNEKFREVFPRLFCGGQAELRLTNEEDLLETGIDIIVQPPGKKLQNVSLLSGGEKALTAVALIFSIFLIKPSPFCLLDEVDAPLDDANIGRFNEMIREMSSFSQFILITHSKTTMAVADILYGVTMEEPGVSKLVSVKLN